MAKSGPQRYPGASTRYWFQSRYGGDAMESNVIVWHTTEGTSMPSYSGGAVAPNFTAMPDFSAKCLRWYQHFDFDVSSRALENHAGGVETNTLNVCQVEIVGTCDPSTHRRWGSTRHLYTADLPDWAIRDLAAFAKWAHDHHGIPLTSDVDFTAYPGSYGANGVRMSYSKWNRYRGHCGHQHVPENAHGDPGALPIEAILAAARGGTITTEEETDMQLSDHVHIGDWVAEAFPEQEGLQDGKILVSTALGSTYGYAHIAADNSTRILAQLGAQAAVIDKLVDAIGDAGGLTAEQVRAAAEEGAQAALDRVAAALTKEQ